jgi:hypothetical protein
VVDAMMKILRTTEPATEEKHTISYEMARFVSSRSSTGGFKKMPDNPNSRAAILKKQLITRKH